MKSIISLFFFFSTILPQNNSLLIGDSLGVGAAPYLRQYGIQVNAYPGRQFVSGVQIAFDNYRYLPSTVIIELGTNGPPYMQNVYSMMSALRLVPHVYFVTVREPRPWQKTVNSLYNRLPRIWHRVRVIRWYKYSAHHPEWFQPDGIHLTPLGYRNYARIIAQAIK